MKTWRGWLFDITFIIYATGLIAFYWAGPKPWSYLGIIGYFIVGWMWRHSDF